MENNKEIEIIDKFNEKYHEFLKKNSLKKGLKEFLFLNICNELFNEYSEFLATIDIKHFSDLKQFISINVYARRRAKKLKFIEQTESRIRKIQIIDARKRQQDFYAEIGMGDTELGKEYERLYQFG